jgi:hypothetical protein
MRIWLACFGVLFALVELYQWVKHLTLPLPVYVLSGAFLAIASNYSKLSGWQEQDAGADMPSVVPSPCHLSQLTPVAPRISFTIRQKHSSDEQ